MVCDGILDQIDGVSYRAAAKYILCIPTTVVPRSTSLNQRQMQSTHAGLRGEDPYPYISAPRGANQLNWLRQP